MAWSGLQHTPLSTTMIPKIVKPMQVGNKDNFPYVCLVCIVQLNSTHAGSNYVPWCSTRLTPNADLLL